LLRIETLEKAYGEVIRNSPSGNKKAEHTSSSFGSSAIFFSRPDAFHPLFTEGLVLSIESHLLSDTVLLSIRGDYVNKKNEHKKNELVKIYFFPCQLE